MMELPDDLEQKVQAAEETIEYIRENNIVDFCN